MKTEEEIKSRLEKLRTDDGDEWPTSSEVLEWVLAPSPVVHEGAEKERCNHASDGWLNKEKVFAAKWNETNHPPSFLNHGVGTLEWLLCSRYRKGANFLRPDDACHELYRHLTQPEATAAASAIQWLGTNCGWCWLEECIRECGFDIVRHRK